MKVRYLIIRFSSIGDIVLTSPVVRCLKQQVDGAEIHFVTKHKYASLVSSSPFIDKVHLFSGNLRELCASLKAENFDYIIDLHKNYRSFWVKFSLGVPSFTFQKLNIQKHLLVNLKVNRLPKKHVVDRYVDTLHAFGVKNDSQGLDFFINENEGYNPADMPVHFRNGYIAFVIAGTWKTKKLPVESVAEICKRVDYPVVLLGGDNEQQEGEEISRLTNGNVINLAGKLTLNESASLVRDANLVLTNDTGLMHIAAAFKKKILSFWGNTVPAFGMTPYLAGSASEVMEVDGLPCRPCSKIGYQSCPNKHFQCMKNHNLDKAVDWVNRNFPSVD